MFRISCTSGGVRLSETSKRVFFRYVLSYAWNILGKKSRLGWKMLRETYRFPPLGEISSTTPFANFAGSNFLPVVAVAVVKVSIPFYALHQLIRRVWFSHSDLSRYSEITKFLMEISPSRACVEKKREKERKNELYKSFFILRGSIFFPTYPRIIFLHRGEKSFALEISFFHNEKKSPPLFYSRSKFHNPISRNSDGVVLRKNATWNKTWAIKLQIR